MTAAHTLQRHLDEGVRQGVFPSAQAVVLVKGQTAFEGAAGAADLTTVFDLASLTKIICTTSLFMRFWADGLVLPHTGLATFLGGTPAGNAQSRADSWPQVLQLLLNQTGPK